MRSTTRIVPWFIVAILGVGFAVGGCGKDKDKKSGDAGTASDGNGTGGAASGTGGRGTGGKAGTAGSTGSGGAAGGAASGGGTVATGGTGGTRDAGVVDAPSGLDLAGVNLDALSLDGLNIDALDLDAIGSCAAGVAAGKACSPAGAVCLLASGGTGCLCGVGTWICR